MPKLTPQDWRKLKNTYMVAFRQWPDKLFEVLLRKVYDSKGVKVIKSNPGSNPVNRDGVDETDALMVYLSRGEPPIQPVD